MTYQTVRNARGEYAVHWTTIEQLNRSFRLAEATLYSAQSVPLNESSWYNPFSWNLPTIYNVEVDWPKVRATADKLTAQDMVGFRALGAQSMADVGNEMLYRIQQTQVLKSRFQGLLSTASSRNQDNIEQAVGSYEGLIDASKFVRDTSFDLVGVGATLLTGGAAATLALGAHATLKGAAKYQDTGSVGVASAQFAGSLVFGAFKIKPALGLAKLSTSGEYVLILAQGTLEAGMSYAAGDSFAKAAQKGVFKVVGDGGAKFVMNSSVAKQLIDRMPVPVNIWVAQKPNPGSGILKKEIDEAATVLAKGAEKIASKVGLPAAANRLGGQAAGSAGNSGGWTADTIKASEVSDFLLKFSIIHMQKGVGWGW